MPETTKELVAWLQDVEGAPGFTPEWTEKIRAAAARLEELERERDTRTAELARLREQENEYKRVIAASGRMRKESSRFSSEAAALRERLDCGTSDTEDGCGECLACVTLELNDTAVALAVARRERDEARREKA